MSKKKAYLELVADRKACTRCGGLANPSRVESGRYDSDEVGPWTRWQGNLNADLMVIGQDWGDVRYLKKNAGVETLANPTNDTLRMLLGLLDIQIEFPAISRGRGRVFLTNAILCMKEGGLQGGVQDEWFTNCKSFLRRQIEIVRPQVVVCLGQKAYESVASAYSFPPCKFVDAVNRRDGELLEAGTRVFARYHCGRRILNTHRSLEQQRRDWKRLGRFLT